MGTPMGHWTPVADVKPSEVIERAITALDNRGWICGSGGWDMGTVGAEEGHRLCIEGALQVGMGLSFTDIGNRVGAEAFRAHPAYRAIQEVVGSNSVGHPWSLWSWNDSVCHSKAQATAVLVQARDLLRERGQ